MNFEWHLLFMINALCLINLLNCLEIMFDFGKYTCFKQSKYKRAVYNFNLNLSMFAATPGRGHAGKIKSHSPTRGG